MTKAMLAGMILQSLALDALRTSWRLPTWAGPGGWAAPSRLLRALLGPLIEAAAGTGSGLRRGSAAAWPVILGRVPVIEGSGSCAPGVLKKKIKAS